MLPHIRTRRARCLVAIVIHQPILSTGAPGSAAAEVAAANVDTVNTNSREVRVAKLEVGAKALHPHIVNLAGSCLGACVATSGHAIGTGEGEGEQGEGEGDG